MNKQISILLGIFTITAAVVNFAPMPKGEVRTEEWIKQQFPTKVDSFSVQGDYKMGELVYKELEPFGIVSNIYGNGEQRYDVTIISSNKEKSFHDPRICFDSQGMTIKGDSTEMVETKSHGSVPLTFVEVGGKNGDMIAAYTYQAPNKEMISSNKRLMNKMFLKALTTMKPQEGIFYRFITQYDGATKEDLKKFIARFFDEASTSSKGYF